MKKILVLVMAVILSFSLVACGGGVNKQAFVDSFNAASTSFDEVGAIVNQNAGSVPASVTEALNKVADMLLKYKDLVNQDLTEEQITEAINFLDTVPAEMAKIKTQVEEIIAGGEVANTDVEITDEQLAAIKSFVEQAAPLYNDAATAAEANGWLADETTKQELNVVYALITSANEGIADPASFNGTTDMDGFIAQLQTILDAMPALQEKVSAPFGE